MIELKKVLKNGNAISEQNIIPVMLTGDNNEVAQSVAKELGINHIHAQLMPEDKEKLSKIIKVKDVKL